MSLPRPDVLLVTADQMRADAMGCAGDPVILATPVNLDAWRSLPVTGMGWRWY